MDRDLLVGRGVEGWCTNFLVVTSHVSGLLSLCSSVFRTMASHSVNSHVPKANSLARRQYQCEYDM